MGESVMASHKVYAIFTKEMLSLFRDKKALMTMLLPVLIYPVMLILFLGVFTMVDRDRDVQKFQLMVHPQVSEGFIEYLKKDERLSISVVEDRKSVV